MNVTYPYGKYSKDWAIPGCTQGRKHKQGLAVHLLQQESTRNVIS